MSSELKDVYVITEKNNDEKAQWTRVGTAIVNRDQSLNVILDMIPLSGKLHIRNRKVSVNKAPIKGEHK
ncbi:hypothetical protein K1X76_02815 [bacterium]|nr:hypothetical protein [bacterium]